MKAIRISQFGGPEVLTLTEAPIPKPGPGEVLVRVHAAGVNPVDAKTRGGVALYRDTRPFPFTPGWDVSGEVVGKGAGIDRFSVGDEVYGMVRFPEIGAAYGEFVAAPQEHLARKPANLSHIEAAALPLVGLTAWQALFDAAHLARGQSVLIHAAAGGVGHIAVQLAKQAGARVYGTASQTHRVFLLRLGLDTFIDHQNTRFEEVAQDVDVVLDTLGGEVRQRSWQVLKPGGVLVSLRGSPFEKVPSRLRGEHVLVRPSSAQMDSLTGLVEQEALRPHIYRVFPVEDAAAAHRLLEQGHTEGKIVLSIGEGD